MYKKISLIDKEISEIINNEAKRQSDHIELIASENYVSEDVINAVGSCLTNKYGEGYPGKRYYGGCEFIDQVELLAQERAKKLFKVNFANVQPYSGSVANAAVYMALLKPGDRVLGLSLDSGGHLTHGYKISFSGIFYESYSYSVNEDGVIDFDELLKIAKKVKPKMLICGYSAYSQIVHFDKFKEIADEVGAYLFADISHISGLIIAGLHPSPVGYADVIMTTTHKTLRGTRGAIILTNNEELAKKIDKAVFPGCQGGALFHQIAGKAVSFFEALQPEFIDYQKQLLINSKVFCQTFINKGAKVISGLTANHLFMIDVKTTYGLTGKEASAILQECNITVNKNSIPNDTESPLVSSGIRLGSAAMTSRGFGEDEFIILANLIDKLLRDPYNDSLKMIIKKEVSKLTSMFPIKRNYIKK
ncbi:serine hydroxymethyltransferase [Mycoplasmopsis arginini]|uniref:Serine hydroxymethyltransferase n=1 Tax=Mycoplasmopsis arginini TaxID=2094 RepID=A0A7Z7GG34_MYCAR|nr:serine hydroxymethyltransferase [Mycoplasmopsis arginini]SGA02704.1 serine hydroxymethyltransferase [Chlamydia abortus]MCY2902847.1 serine hydroxymethyltransferase [Mycoplasmopsis arginini QMP CG1-2758]MDI3349584.1 serine hydroxymethyltransferase [Mycoplasmopsis arginini]MDI3350052.1 serine hydroxymethyltransferase [Mycoplasmopsis arginini]MDI3350629.1 serine hydroxymethyltransferase [Mycoplasmopsis arginini]